MFQQSNGHILQEEYLFRMLLVLIYQLDIVLLSIYCLALMHVFIIFSLCNKIFVECCFTGLVPLMLLPMIELHIIKVSALSECD
jgi:hypothetical protein